MYLFFNFSFRRQIAAAGGSTGVVAFVGSSRLLTWLEEPNQPSGWPFLCRASNRPFHIFRIRRGIGAERSRHALPFTPLRHLCSQRDLLRHPPLRIVSDASLDLLLWWYEILSMILDSLVSRNSHGNTVQSHDSERDNTSRAVQGFFRIPGRILIL